MAKATDSQIKNAKEAMAAGTAPADKLRINFGDPDPIQKADMATADTASPAKTDK